MKHLSKFLGAAGLLLVFTAPVFGQSDPKVEKRVVAVVGQDGVQRVEILGGSYFYDPNYVVVKVNVPVEITLRREAGMTPHDFAIKAPEAGIDVSAEMDTKPRVMKFTPTKAGKYPFICTKKMIFMKSHQDKGMKGMLEVAE